MLLLLLCYTETELPKNKDADKSTPGVNVGTDVADVEFSRDPGMMVVLISIENHGQCRKVPTS